MKDLPNPGVVAGVRGCAPGGRGLRGLVGVELGGIAVNYGVDKDRSASCFSKLLCRLSYFEKTQVSYLHKTLRVILSAYHSYTGTEKGADMAAFNPSVVLKMAVDRAEEEQKIPEYARVSIISTIDTLGFPLVRDKNDRGISTENVLRTVDEAEMSAAVSFSYDLILYAVEKQLNATDAFYELVRQNADDIVSEALRIAPSVSSDSVRENMVRFIMAMDGVTPRERLEAIEDALSAKSLREMLDEKGEDNVRTGMIWAQDGDMRRHIVLSDAPRDDDRIATVSENGVEYVNASEVMPTGGRATWMTESCVEREGVSYSQWDGRPAWMTTEDNGVVIVIRPDGAGEDPQFDHLVGWAEGGSEIINPTATAQSKVVPLSL